MSDLHRRFEDAASRAKGLSRPSNEALLDLYALFKQATVGDVSGEKPGMFDMVGRAKYEAWAKRKGMSHDDAKQAYVELVDSLAGS
jgi:acyl-CoA-binding protein